MNEIADCGEYIAHCTILKNTINRLFNPFLSWDTLKMLSGSTTPWLRSEEKELLSKSFVNWQKHSLIQSYAFIIVIQFVF